MNMYQAAEEAFGVKGLPIGKMCSVFSCSKPIDARGWCSTHYKRWQTTGVLDPSRPIAPHKPRVKCSVENCNNLNVSAKATTEYCDKHYHRFIRGMPVLGLTIFEPRYAIIEGEIAKIPLGLNAKDGYAIVDKEFSDLDKYQWRIGSGGYAKRSVQGKRGASIFMHHVIIGKPSKGMCIDHINRNKLDNRKSNLREVTMSVNTLNRKIQSNNISGFRGVFFHKGKWRPSIRKNGKSKRGSEYDTPEEAAKEYNKMFKEAFGDTRVLMR